MLRFVFGPKRAKRLVCMHSRRCRQTLSGRLRVCVLPTNVAVAARTYINTALRFGFVAFWFTLGFTAFYAEIHLSLYVGFELTFFFSFFGCSTSSQGTKDMHDNYFGAVAKLYALIVAHQKGRCAGICKFLTFNLAKRKNLILHLHFFSFGLFHFSGAFLC